MVDKGSTSGRLVLPMGDDMHTHLRQGELMDAVVPHLRKGGWWDCQTKTLRSISNHAVATRGAGTNRCRAVDAR